MKTFITNYITLILILGSITACEDFVQIDPPRTSLVKKTVFEDDVTANAAIQDIYYRLQSSNFASGGANSISFLATLLTDEQINYINSGLASYDAQYQQFNDNTLQASNSVVLSLWTDLYKCIYKTNAVIEGLVASNGVSEDLRKQLTGEAKFIRAFCYFYLVNLWGDVPLVVTTDWRVNSVIARTPIDEVYQQIINDLVDAKNSLPTDYSFSGNERVRANAAVASALLARTHLFREEWADAEAESSLVISNPAYAFMNDMIETFHKNSSEAIWQLWIEDTFLPNDLYTFYIFSSGPSYGSMRDVFVNSFEADDQRRSNWVRSRTIASTGISHYFSVKYQSFTSGVERSTVFRVGEQYLNRAEARARQNDLDGAKEDLNTIRTRAGLSEITANDAPSILDAIQQERKSELFTEWGHRWFDLKRLNRAETTLSPIKPGWTSASLLLPIPESEIINNPALRGAQNPGY